MNEIFLLTGIPYGIFILYIIINCIISFRRGLRKLNSELAGFLMLFAEIIFTTIAPAIGFWRFDNYGSEIPFAKHHVISIIILVVFSSSAFWIARFNSKSNNPWFRILLSAGLLQGIILCFFTSLHFVSFIPLGIIFPLAGFELLSPVIALFLLLREFYIFNKYEPDLEFLLPYREQMGLIPFPFRILRMPFLQRLLYYLLVMCFLLAFEIMIAYGLGQEINSIIKAFTQSTGFLFSKFY